MNTCIKFFLLIFVGVLTNTTFAQDTISSDKLNDAAYIVDAQSEIKKSDQYTHYITFEVKIDSLGNVLKATVVKKNISKELTKKSHEKIYKMKFPAGKHLAKGVVTFAFKEEDQ